MSTLSVKDGDIELTPAGNLVLAEGVSALEQQTRQRLRFVRGESFAHANTGVPYFQQVLGDHTAGLASVAIADELRLVHGVDRVISAVASFDPDTRTLGLQATVYGEDGSEAAVTETL